MAMLYIIYTLHNYASYFIIVQYTYDTVIALLPRTYLLVLKQRCGRNLYIMIPFHMVVIM